MFKITAVILSIFLVNGVFADNSQKEDCDCQVGSVSKLNLITPLDEAKNVKKLTKVEEVLEFLAHMPGGQYKTLDALCLEARKQDPNKQFLLWTMKTHACDSKKSDNYGMCLINTYTVSDPQNKFVQDNFLVFHSKLDETNKESKTGKYLAGQMAGLIDEGFNSRALSREENQMPGGIHAVVDIQECTYLGFVEDFAWTKLDKVSRYKSLRQSLLKIPEVATKLEDDPQREPSNEELIDETKPNYTMSVDLLKRSVTEQQKKAFNPTGESSN